MKHVPRSLLTLSLFLVPHAAFAQLSPVILEAEGGSAGSQFTVAADGATTYAAIQSTIGGGNPTTGERVITFAVTFPHAGVWELYARLRVGPATFNDDSMFYANGFGAKSPTSDADWILGNGLAATVGFTNPADKVTGGGLATSGVWKWVKLSAFDGGEPPVSFTVPAGALTQTFSVAGREDGLWLDKFAFGPQGVFFTVFDLDNGLPGTTEPPPPPFVPTGPPIATGKPKFLGSVSSPAQNRNFAAYFNQVTPENAGKWGSVEPTRDVMNWAELDFAYNLAKTNGFPFRLHTLIWGNQQPGWIASLPAAEQREEIEEWFALVAARYPDIDFIDVVNEPLHDPPDDPADGGYIAALGGAGATGWDWVIEAFRLARRYFPDANLGLNEFSVTNTTSDMIRYVAIVELLKREHLIDSVGVQGHAFSTRPNIPMATHAANLDRLAAAGLPIYVTELDIDGPTDEIQLADYQRIFPVFWEHPAVRGITLWGYRPGHWRTAQGAYIVHENGAERPAMTWLKEYVAATQLAPWVTLQPTAKTVTVGDDVAFGCRIFGAAPLAYEWRHNGEAIAGNPTASTASLTLTTVTTAAAGTYTCAVSHAGGSTVGIPATLAVNKALAAVTLGRLAVLYDGAPKAVSVTTVPAGVPVVVTYDGSAAPPTAPGSYAVLATVDSPDYLGSAAGVLVISTTALSRHAPAIGGTVDGSLQMLSPESVALREAVVSGDLLVPGTPPVILKDQPNYLGTIEGSGNPSPSGYIVTISGNATLRHVVRATDPVAFPAIPLPPGPTGTRDVVLKSPEESAGDFETVRDLTLKDGIGQVAVPAGTYGAVSVNAGSGLTLGDPGSTGPAVYNLQSLTLREGSRIEVVGRVVLNIAREAAIGGVAGSADEPHWLAINVAAGGAVVSGAVNGYVAAPAGIVTINSGATVLGGVAADRLVIRDGGAVRRP
jgi:GH35 family endo-1,4-beta-xylanase